jgi:hypothetical protein
MIDSAERLCTPEQAMQLKRAGLIQQTMYAWYQENGEWKLTYEDGYTPEEQEAGASGPPIITDWKEEVDCYAAFDLSDLGLILRSLGFYLSGPVYQVPGLPIDKDRIFWADDINTVTDPAMDTYRAYGRWEAEARAALLLVLIDEGRPPMDWPFYIVDKISQVVNLVNKKTYGEK